MLKIYRFTKLLHILHFITYNYRYVAFVIVAPDFSKKKRGSYSIKTSVKRLKTQYRSPKLSNPDILTTCTQT